MEEKIENNSSNNNKDKLNSSNTSSLQLNVQPTTSVIESLNLIEIKNKKIKKPKLKLNILDDKTNANKVNITTTTENQLNTISSQEGNPQIKYHQKIIFAPAISIFFFIEFLLRVIYLINTKEINDIEKRYYKFLIFFHLCFIYLSYFLSMFTDPSQTNINKKYSVTEESLSKLEPKLEKDFWEDYCDYCRCQKFIRSNHCNICNKCVLLKFNHCFFIANCIGFKNVQYVINFLVLTICWLYKFQIHCVKYFNKGNNFNFILTIFFILNFPLLLILFYYFLSLMFDIFNNQTKYERKKTNNLLDRYFPLYKCNDTDNKFRFPNVFNIGYLSHFYYLVGNTLLHFFLPLPKNKNYEIEEMCPIFKGCRQFDKIEFVNNMVKRNEAYKNSIKDRYMEPDSYINFCRQKFNQIN